MTVLVSIFGMAGRVAGDLLTSALGWASSLLFGRVPRSHQILVVLMMAASFVWLVMVLGLLVPSVASLLLSATPHPPFMNQAWLGFALVVAVIVMPLGVGLAGYLVPSEGERADRVSIPIEVLRGYLLTPVISGLLIFLAGVGIQQKVRSKRHGWSDTHVPIVVKAGGYDQMVADLHDALRSAAIPTDAEEAPWVLTVPALLLTRVAGRNVRKLRPDRLMMLTGHDLKVGVYPSDIAISGATKERTRARAALLSRLTTTSAHLTMSAEAQKVEDRLARLADTEPSVGRTLPAVARAEFDGIDAMLLDLAVPTDEWDILYRVRLQIERDLLLGAVPGTEFPGDRAGRGDSARAQRSPEQGAPVSNAHDRGESLANQAADGVRA